MTLGNKLCTGMSRSECQAYKLVQKSTYKSIEAWTDEVQLTKYSTNLKKNISMYYLPTYITMFIIMYYSEIIFFVTIYFFVYFFIIIIIYFNMNKKSWKAYPFNICYDITYFLN